MVLNASFQRIKNQLICLTVCFSSSIYVLHFYIGYNIINKKLEWLFHLSILAISFYFLIHDHQYHHSNKNRHSHLTKWWMKKFMSQLIAFSAIDTQKVIYLSFSSLSLCFSVFKCNSFCLLNNKLITILSTSNKSW